MTLSGPVEDEPRPRRWGRRLLAAVAILILAAGGAVVAGLPSRDAVRALASSNPGETSLMRQRAAEGEARGRTPRRVQSWIPLDRVSRHLLHALIAAEDSNFFDHGGVDWQALRESLATNWERGRFARGGSTLTQQLAKNLFFTTDKNLLRKARELIVSHWLERDLTKERILELYVNVIEWGPGLYGCEAAARRYYGRSCASLDAEQAAGLAAMVPNPRRINPETSPKTHARAQRRVRRLMEVATYVRTRVSRLGAGPPATAPPLGLDLEPPELPTPPVGEASADSDGADSVAGSGQDPGIERP
jgi:monofunctional biosynthetic peptidoglycan transglycosylase